MGPVKTAWPLMQYGRNCKSILIGRLGLTARSGQLVWSSWNAEDWSTEAGASQRLSASPGGHAKPSTEDAASALPSSAWVAVKARLAVCAG